MKTSLFLLAAAALSGPALPIAAQEPTDPPPVLRIIREDIKEGKSAAHAKSENAFMQEAARLKYPANIIGMTTVTGPSQAWFLEAHASFEAIQTTMAAFDRPDGQYAKLDELDSEFRSSSRVLLAVYRPDISFHGQEIMPNLPKTRFFNVEIMRIQAGRDDEFAEIGHMAVDAYQKSMSDQPVAVYEVVSGLPNGTYLLFQPTASLKALDTVAARNGAMVQAMGDTGSKRFFKAVSETIVSDEPLLFSIDPRMSYVSKEVAAADPAFWNPKPAEAKASTKARPKVALQPAAK